MAPRKRTISHEKAPATVDALLNSFFWLPTLQTMQSYGRLHDDHDGTKEGVLQIVFSPDGDAHVAIAGGPESGYSPTLRFRTYEGGGLSLRTRNALLILAEAIRLDNLEHPNS